MFPIRSLIPMRIIPAKHSIKMAPAARQNLLPIDSPERKRLPPLLRRAWYGLNHAFRRRTVHLEITPDQFTVMRTLLENDGITQRELRSEEHTSELQSHSDLVCRLLLEKQ